ncbi:hypothetical protein TCAL_12515 [Tigriopus californicus]|uniref:PDZ domain-containing protein n=1 Tax=Tigriopus californicus TaxID=6832 RepID=A0A553PTG6_TIGCA|nr:hypothetical protein TCAL_12515 [Tigriopus californicus]
MGPPPLPPPNSNHAPPLPPIKRQPINLHDLQSSLSSGGNGMNNVEVNLARYANQYQHYYHAHHSHNHGPETVVDGTVIHPRHASSARQYALPGDTHNAYYHTHHHPHGGHPPHGQMYKPANRSSHSSDTSSAYSGSDTMQSIHSSLENEAVVDLSGLHESVVDSDEEELADGMGQMVIRDLVRECLEKDPADRNAKDIEVLLEFSKTLEAFNNMTLATRRALCSVMVFAVVEKAGTVVMNHEEELDSWSVIINGEVRIDDPNPGSNNNHALNNQTTSTFPNLNQSQTNNTNNNNNNQHHPNVTRSSRSNNHGKYLKIGDSFGITATMDKLYHQGVMKTCMDDCQFVCITQNDYYKILKEEATNQRRYEENGQIVLVTDPDPNEKLSHKVIRGTPDRLLLQLIDENSSANESTYVEDFLLTHRTFLNSSMEVAHKLLEWFNEGTLCDRVTRVLLLWVHNHFTDFETDPQMMEFLEKFEVALESRKKMNGQLRLLNFACAEKARKRIITLRRSSREEPLQFSLMGGYERGFGIFVERVEKNSKASEIGLKRGDQILDVNRKSFENNMSLPRALTFLKESTHLELTVKSNLLGQVTIGKMKALPVIPGRKSGKVSKKGHFKVHSISKDPLASKLDSLLHNERFPHSCLSVCLSLFMACNALMFSVFKELLQTPENSPRSRLRKASDQTAGGRSNSEYTVNSKSKRAHDDSSGSLKSNSSSSSLPINAMRGRDRVKAMLKSLIKPKMGFPGALYPESDVANLGIVSDHSNDSWDFTSDLPDHSLKIYRADQHFRYLLVHKNTSAREVVMLALQEFGISDCSSNFTLCEVTVEGNLVRQKRLPDEQTNLAERIGLASRYYIKNILSSEQLIPEDAKAELNKEAQVNLLQLNAIEAAMQLMVEDFTIFRSIESTEHVDKLFELESKFGTPNLDRFGDLVNREMMWVITEIVSESNVNRRVKIIKQFIKVAHNCFKETQNYNSMFAITSGLDHGAVKRLKSTWEKVPSKYLKLLEEMRMVMEPSMNFRRYRNLVNSSKPPIIPIYPMVSKDLTFLHLGNETHIDGLINFEKLRMIAEKIRDLSNMCSTPLDVTSMLDKQGSQLGTALGNMVPAQGGATIKRGTRGKSKEALNAKKMYEEAQMVRRVKAYLTKMPVIRDEERLHQLSVEVEPPPSNPHPALTVPSSSAVSGGSIKALSAQNSTASINSMGVRAHIQIYVQSLNSTIFKGFARTREFIARAPAGMFSDVIARRSCSEASQAAILFLEPTGDC